MDKEQKDKEENTNQKKGFWKEILDKLDQAMLEKSKQTSCCSKDSKGGKCC